ncbi:hypothetical protein FMN50_11505 [Rhodobacterales bacterium]|nr:hypothetical protein FMN50_11505 [Rhodobacterales bacterium]
MALRSLHAGVEQELTNVILVNLVSYEAYMISVIILVVAGCVLFADKNFQVTSRYGEWRMVEYAIRKVRSEFLILFFAKFGSKSDAETTELLFNEARILCFEQFARVEELIKSETDSWNQSMVVAMAGLTQRIDGDTNELKRIAIETEQKEQAVRRSANEQIATLQVSINDRDDPKESLKLSIIDAEGNKEVVDKLMPKGQKTFLLHPSAYVVALLDGEDKEIGSKTVRLKAAEDLPISI